jgi:hypothetical protein
MAMILCVVVFGAAIALEYECHGLRGVAAFIILCVAFWLAGVFAGAIERM